MSALRQGSPLTPARPSPYITREGHQALQAELAELWQSTRPALVQKVTEAAAMGDRSENAEYIYGKKQLHETDRRIRHLSRRFDELTVVERPPTDQTRVFFGAWVTLLPAGHKPIREGLGRGLSAHSPVAAPEDGPRHELNAPAARAPSPVHLRPGDFKLGGPDQAEGTLQFRLVGPDEADAAAGGISIDSPMARALLNKQVGIEVRVKDEAWRLVAIRYATEKPTPSV